MNISAQLQESKHQFYEYIKAQIKQNNAKNYQR